MHLALYLTLNILFFMTEISIIYTTNMQNQIVRLEDAPEYNQRLEIVKRYLSINASKIDFIKLNMNIFNKIYPKKLSTIDSIKKKLNRKLLNLNGISRNQDILNELHRDEYSPNNSSKNILSKNMLSLKKYSNLPEQNISNGNKAKRYKLKRTILKRQAKEFNQSDASSDYNATVVNSYNSFHSLMQTLMENATKMENFLRIQLPNFTEMANKSQDTLQVLDEEESNFSENSENNFFMRDMFVYRSSKTPEYSHSLRGDGKEHELDFGSRAYLKREFKNYWAYYRKTKRELEYEANIAISKAERKIEMEKNKINKKINEDKEKNPKDIYKRLLRVIRDIFSPAEKLMGAYIGALNSTRNFLAGVPNSLPAYENKQIPYDILIKQYNLYYECLRKKKQYYTDTLGQPMINVEALLVHSLDKLTLECHMCLPPYAQAPTYNVKWLRRLQIGTTGFELLPDDETLFAMNVDGDLIINGITPDSAGMYTCFKSTSQETTYLIGIENIEDRIRVEESGNAMSMPAKATELKENNLLLFSKWSQWSDCNTCGSIGMRKRIGTCMIQKFDKKNPILPKDSKVLNSFVEGLPCRSPLLPLFVAELEAVKARKTEVMSGYCNIDCITASPIKSITDEKGDVIELVLTAKGRHSMRDPPPARPPEVVRTNIFVTVGQRIILVCPHPNASRLSVRWQNGTNILEEHRLNQLTLGRIYIDYYNTLIIKSARFSDEAPYSCWINFLHIATMKLFVKEAFALDKSIYNSLSYLGLFATIAIIIYSFVRLQMLQRSRGAYMR